MNYLPRMRNSETEVYLGTFVQKALYFASGQDEFKEDDRDMYTNRNMRGVLERINAHVNSGYSITPVEESGFKNAAQLLYLFLDICGLQLVRHLFREAIKAQSVATTSQRRMHIILPRP